MFKRPLVKPLLGAAALIALTAVFSSSAANAGPASCSAYARDVAASEAPRRGLIDGVLIGTLDAVFTGGAGADERYREIPVIIVTSRDSMDDRRRGFEVGADAYVLKREFDQSQLLDTVRRLIGRGIQPRSTHA